MHGFDEAFDHEFGCAVYAPTRPRNKPTHRTQVENMTRLTCSHGRQRSTRNIQSSFDVHREGCANLLSRYLLNRTYKATPGIIDQDIDLTELFQRCVYS